MMIKMLCKLTIFSILWSLCGALPYWLEVQPQQIHISYWTKPSEMMIVWSQVNQTRTSVVLYGLDTQLDQQATGSSAAFVDGGSEHRVQYISRVLLEGLIPGKTYTYVVGNEYEYSDKHSFRAMPEGEDWSPRLAVYGDMGNENAQSLPRLEAEAFANHFDAILHVGDMAYDMKEHQGQTGDEFMRQIEPLASSVPYMTCVGNHENAYNFSHYRKRFSMPGDEGRMYYSFNMGPVHFVAISTELIFFWHYGPLQVYRQYEWLKQDLEVSELTNSNNVNMNKLSSDTEPLPCYLQLLPSLKEANKPENRTKRPWIIVFGHRPMYCSGNDDDDCRHKESRIRVGIPGLHVFGFEDVFYEYGVDLAIWAHEHEYERLWPIYDWKVMNGSYDQPYTNPKAPVHIITGSAGCRENHTGFIKHPEFWSAFRSSDYGYSHLHVLNKTHLQIVQISDDKGGQVVDKFTLIKTSHGPYEPTSIKQASNLPKPLSKEKYFTGLPYKWAKQ